MGCTSQDLLRWLLLALGDLYLHTSLVIDGMAYLIAENSQLQIEAFERSV